MPVIDLEICSKCQKCVKDCPANAINLAKGEILSKCIHCGHCVAICPEGAISPDHGELTPLLNGNITGEDFESHFAGQRSIRSYKKKAIEPEIIEKLTGIMKHYASASNTRLMEITLITSQEKIRELNDSVLDTLIKAISRATSPVTAPLINVIKPGIDLKGLRKYLKGFIKQRQNNVQSVCYEAPLVMIFHAPKISESMLDADGNIWAANTISYARSLGLGSCYIGFIVKAMKRNKKIKSAMGIPAKHNVHAALTLGYPAVGYNNETGRAIPRVHHIK